jgi:hypothetical protein
MKGFPLLLCCAIAPAAAPDTSLDERRYLPIADVHLHFNWDQQEIIRADEAVAKLRVQGVVLAVVSSTPSHLALKLHDAGGDWIIPFFSPYITADSRNSWFRDPEVLNHARSGLASGRYRGIGEVHLWSGISPRPDNPVFTGLLDLAVDHDVPVSIHTESGDFRFFARICTDRPRVRFLWAHAGGRLGADAVAAVIKACPNVWIELSARDPWRYDSLVDSEGRLPREWIELITGNPRRFMIGSDPVWNVRRGQRWDEADDGWSYLDRLLGFHRAWLEQLPPAVERQVRLTNARRLLARGSQGPE